LFGPTPPTVRLRTDLVWTEALHSQVEGLGVLGPREGLDRDEGHDGEEERHEELGGRDLLVPQGVVHALHEHPAELLHVQSHARIPGEV
jgi:hypothetical protein